MALPALSDNYIWLLHDGAQAVVVDPGDAGPVRQALARLNLRLSAIFITHHHGDHIGGVAELHHASGCAVYGPAHERLPGPCCPVTPVRQGDAVPALGLAFTVLDVPGHTLGHLAYVSPPAPAPLLLCGDTLFSAGCGRLFEGTPAQMHDSLQRLAALPGQTLLCCAHEYTLANLKFAQAVEPGNAAIATHLADCVQRRARSLPTLPSTLHVERQINPFLRCAVPAVAASASAHGAASDSPQAMLAALREWKNHFA